MKEKICIINTEYKIIIKHLNSLGYKCVPVVKSSCVSEEINRHSDVLYLKVQDNKICVSSCQKENFDIIKNKGYEVIEVSNLKKGYKYESLLNFVITEKLVIKNHKTALNLNFFDKKEILVNQGYTRCSLIALKGENFITEDEGIYKTLIDNNLNCLKIKKGMVKLKGHEYGFIGGASIYLKDENILFFAGDIKDSSEKEKVVNFLNKYSVKPYFIENEELIDIGSALII